MDNATQNKEEFVRGYYRFSKAWFATDKDLANPTVQIGLYHPVKGTAGEISITWETIRGEQVPVLHAYDDGWRALSTFSDLIKEMAAWNNKNITEQQFVQLLDKTGFTDLTPYEQKQGIQKVKHARQQHNT